MPTDRVAQMEQLHAEHGAALWGHCLRLTGYDRAHAEDVAQETLLRAWRHLPRLEAGNGSVRAWLFTVARNIVVDEWRRTGTVRELSVAQVAERADEQDHTDEVLMSWLVAEALTHLSPEHRDVLRECYFRGQSVAAAADHLGIPQGTVKSRTHYALRALRLTLEEMGVTP